MRDDKPPKHKPQKKHTLNEVLKSLQDLIRTDLITAQSASKPAPAPSSPEAKAPPVAPAAPIAPAAPVAETAPNEPDSFNDALEQLDDIITQNIIKPVERARQTPPEPLLPDETIEIEWDDALAAPPEDKATAEAPAPEPEPEPPLVLDDVVIEESTITIEAPAAPEPKPSASEAAPLEAPAANNVIELETFEAKAVDDGRQPSPPPEPEPRNEDNVVPLEVVVMDASDTPAPPPVEATANETAPEPSAVEEISLAGPEPTAPPDLQGTFEFVLGDAKREKMPPEEPPASAEPTVERKTTLTIETTETKSEKHTIDFDDLGTPPAEISGSTESPPPPPVEELPTLTVEFDISDSSTPMLDSASAETPDNPKPMPDTVIIEAPASLSDPAQTVEPKETPPKKETSPAPTPERSADKPAEKDSVPKQEEIPVLKEIAELSAAQAPALPDPGQARDIAIRVIAKLNIERRKAGEKPLDIKTIEKLQQYLSEALSKRTLNKKPK